MCFTSSIEESLFDLTGELTVISSANLINLLISGCLGFISSTIRKKRNGPMTVPCGTPLLILAYSVMNPSTTTLCFRFVKKLIIQLMIYGFRLVCFSFSGTTLRGTESKALLKSNYDKTLIKSASSSSHFSQ